MYVSVVPAQMTNLHRTCFVMCGLCVEGGREHEDHDPLHTPETLG